MHDFPDKDAVNLSQFALDMRSGASRQSIDFFDERGEAMIAVHSSHERGGVFVFDSSGSHEKRLFAISAHDGQSERAAMKCRFRYTHDSNVCR